MKVADLKEAEQTLEPAPWVLTLTARFRPLDRALAFLRNALPALIELFEVCEAERDAKCLGPGALCNGENHVEECPCEVARQDRIAMLNKIEGL